MSEIQALLKKADRSFEAAELILKSGSPDFAASRAYYGCFYIAEALLLARGQDFSSQAQVISQYGLTFARTDELDQRFHQLLLRAFKIRQYADYQIEVTVEDLNVAGMLTNRRLARRLSDAALAELRRQFTYKARWYRTVLHEADRWYPSSKTCSACGRINDDLTLGDVTWTCPNPRCGVPHDRDHNAAVNLARWPGKHPPPARVAA